MPRRGDIVLIPFPFSDLSGQKIRPALILSDNIKNRDIVVVFITSKAKTVKDITVSVFPTENNGIKVKSTVVCDKIATLDKKMIIGSIGFLEIDTLNAVNRALCKVLGLK